MADNDDDVEGPEASDDEATVETPDAGESDVGRTGLKVLRARLTLEEEAAAARRRVLGASRGRSRPAMVQTNVADDDEADLRERLRELVRGVEEETERLQDDVSRLRSAAGRAGATLQEEIERAANELAEQSTEELQATVGETPTESLEAPPAAIDTLQETTGSLNNVATGLLTSV